MADQRIPRRRNVDGTYTLVAVPSKDDYVWNLSSEKVPHMTLLVFDSKVANLNDVLEYIQHVVRTTLNESFTLLVDHRGVLGDKDADVLFFSHAGLTDIREAQEYIRQHPDVWKAWHAVEQYPQWTPHLTLGYPKTPAKKDPRDYPGTYSVNFDRLELWTGDYEGPVFPLIKPAVSELTMTSTGGDILAHYGVKGMKWGVTRVDAGRSGGKNYSQDASAARRTQQKLQKHGGTHVLSNKELQGLLTRINLEQQYARMKAAEPTAIDKGRKAFNNVMSVGASINTVVSFVNSPAGKLIRKTLVGV